MPYSSETSLIVDCCYCSSVRTMFRLTTYWCICLVGIEIVVGVEHLVGVEQHDGVEHLVVVEQHDGVERRGDVAWKCFWC